MKDIVFALPPKAPYLQGKIKVEIDAPEYGIYKLDFDYPGENQTNEYRNDQYYFVVSDLAVFSRSSEKGKYEFFVVNRTDGKPIPNAKIEIYKHGSWRSLDCKPPLATVTANAQGLAVYDKETSDDNLYYRAVAGNDNGAFLNSLPDSHYEYSDGKEKWSETVTIFTDRNLYRPGQTVFFKAVAAVVTGNKSEIAAGKSVQFILHDANRREVNKQMLKTNEFGSVSGEFVLPQGSLPGHFSISSGNNSVYFRVEEYKRPTFEVVFDKIEKTYKFGQEIALVGKAENFSGIKLRNVAVSYRITRRQMARWWWSGHSEEVAYGDVVTGENGQFEIKFTPEKPDAEKFQRQTYLFEIETTVTDVNGETQTGNYSFPVGDVSMLLNLEIPEKWEKSSAEEIAIYAKNLEGNEIKTSGTYRVFSLRENDSINRQTAQGNFETGLQPALKKQLKKLPSGKYRIRLQTHDDSGNEITDETDIILFSYSDKRPPLKTNEWLVVKNRTFSAAKPAEVLFGVCDNVNVLYELWQKNTLLHRQWITLDNENRLFSFPAEARYNDGIILKFTYVKEQKFYAQSIDLLPEKEEKKLTVNLEVFRDKIRPGTREEWRISITDATGKPALAEVMAAMYDFSLDKIYPAQDWSLYSENKNFLFPRMNLRKDLSFDSQSIFAHMHNPPKEVVPFVFDRFNWFDFSLFFYGRTMLRGATMLDEQVASYDLAEKKMPITHRYSNPPPLPESEMAESGMIRKNNGVQHVNIKEESLPVQIRRNFNETAFFYPQLRTNEKGETQIAFTVPESNTRWRFRLLAHDKNLVVGQAEAFAVSQKELMITSNLPRFLRQGDRASISAKISNLSDSLVNGTAKLELFNPVTDEVLNTISVENRSQAFSLAKEASSSVSWTFGVPDDVEVIGVRIVAQSASFSDGEQHALAVLPNRMLVTESLQMNINGMQNKTFTMNSLLNNTSTTVDDYRLMLEFTANPAWYAVQALPPLGVPGSDNAVSWFASCYANILGAHIGKTYPKISAMIDLWKKQGSNSETLLSNLEKNEELKNVLLQETPWVLEAQNESEQKQKLIMLFDLNRAQNLTRQALDNLGKLQTEQGGWSWFKGFYPNRSMTQYILYGFSRLKELNAFAFSDDIRAMQEKAVSYIDAEALRSFEKLKTYDKEWRKIQFISTADLEYLYVRAHYPDYPLNETGREMVNFYTSVIEKNWTHFDLYERSLIAVLAQKNGNQNLVRDILKSYREHAVINDEMGMHWANNRASVFMSQSAVSVHTFIMDAFRIGGANADEIDSMKRWLLKQKQTQQWESTHATMDAVYALLSTGTDWFSSENKVVVTVGDKIVEPAKKELGTGYFKKTWRKPEITSRMGRVKIENSGSAPAWGALYWQYYEELDKITRTDASLDVEKRLFVEKTDASGKKLLPVMENHPLHVGDKVIVRLTVRTDRDLDFVHLKDMRAAAFEPVEQLSGMKWQDKIRYYQAMENASVNFYFDVLPRGTYVLEYAVFVVRTGDYSNGIATIQCLYAPEFVSHTSGMRIEVK